MIERERQNLMPSLGSCSSATSVKSSLLKRTNAEAMLTCSRHGSTFHICSDDLKPGLVGPEL